MEAHDALAPALEGFAPTPLFPQIAEAKALFEALAADETVKADAARRAQRLKLQTSYGQAVMWAKGHAAEETKAAFARLGQLTTEKGDAHAPIDAYYGRWGHAFFRGELGSARETAENFLRDAERTARPTEMGIAHRLLGMTLLWQGDLLQGRAHCEQALRIYAPERDGEAKFHIGSDTRVAATTYLAIAAWCFGEIARARELMDKAVVGAAESAHVPTLVNTYYGQGLLEILRDDAEAARRAAEACVALSRERGLALWLAVGALPSAWARAKLADRASDSAELREALAEYSSQGNRLFLPFYLGLLAEIEAEGEDMVSALAGIDGALALAGETGEHWFDSGLHRIRGEILIKQNPADPALAEAAFLAAIAVAQQQKARNFELRAALSLAKLYQSTGRPIDAHDVLAPAQEGFSPTPEFPQIAEAKALFEALAADQTVKADAARRAQRLKLQTNYSQAVLWAKGYAAEETKAAYARAGELATEIGNAEAPFDAYYGRWGHTLFRGELGSARETAEGFLREAERARRPTEEASAHRLLAAVLLFQGDFAQARAHCEQTLQIYDPERDREAKFRVGTDARVAATCYLALTAWCVGDVGSARELIDEAGARAVESAHAPTLATTHYCQAWLEVIRDDAEAALRAAEACVALSRERGLALYLRSGALTSDWARAKLGDRDSASTGLRQAVEAYARQGNKVWLPFYRALLAEIEAERGDAEAALAGIDEALALAGETGEHWFDAALHRIRGEILIKQNPADPAPAEAAFLAAIAVAQQQKARSFELRAALSLAKLYQSTGRPIDAHDALWPALAGFAPTPEFPQIAEAKALFEALAADQTVKAELALRKQRAQLHLSLGNALIHSRGFAAPETMAAFARAREHTGDGANAADRLSAIFGQWIACYIRAELAPMRELAAAFLSDVALEPESAEAGVGHRMSGTTLWFAGEYAAAREHLERAVALFRPGRDDELTFRFSHDVGVAAMSYLALTLWPLGEVDRARQVVDEMTRRVAGHSHVGTLATGFWHAAAFEVLCGNGARAAGHARALRAIVQEHNLAAWRTIANFLEGWMTLRSGELSQGLRSMRAALDGARYKGRGPFNVFFSIAVAEAASKAGEYDRSLAGIDAAIVGAEDLGCGNFRAEALRIRGEILLRQNPADPAPAEAAFLAAIAVAQQQKARSFGLRAALSLAKLYQSTGRPIDAHDALGPALAGFAPTPEFPQIAEAKALFEALSADEAVKADAVRRAQRLKLQSNYGHAVMWSKGFTAEETKAAYARVGRIAKELGDADAQLEAYYVQWVRSQFHGELVSAREAAENFLSEAERAARPTDAGVGHRILGMVLWLQGGFPDALTHFNQTLQIYEPERDREAKFRFSQDSRTAATGYLAIVTWLLGDFGRARELIETAGVLAIESAHAPTRVNTYNTVSILEILRGDAGAARRTSEAMLALAREHGLALFLALGALPSVWARANLGDRDAGPVELRQALGNYSKQGNKVILPFYQGLLAEIEAERGGAAVALAEIDGALALVGETGEHWFDAGLHRIRGEILLKQNPADPARAEAAFLAAIAVAQQQKARSFELRAALSLAKLYQSTGRLVEAHDALAAALEGIGPTPELTEIAEAQTLLAALEETEAVRIARRNRGIRAKYAQALLITQGHTSAATQAAYDRVNESGALPIGDTERWAVLYGHCTRHIYAGEMRAALDVAEFQLREAEAANLPIYAVLALRLISATKFQLGSLIEARGLAERILEMYDERWADNLRALTGMDFLCQAYVLLALPAWALGETETAEQTLRRAARRAEDVAQPLGLAHVLNNEAVLVYLADRPEDALRVADALRDVTAAHAIGAFDLAAKLYRGWAYGRLTDATAGAREVHAASTALRERGAHIYERFALAMTAEFEAASGSVDEALAVLARGLEMSAQREMRLTLPRLHRVRGEILFARDPAQAEEAYRESIRIAREQSARTLVLLAALPLAKLLQTDNRPLEAYDALTLGLEGFSPTPQLPEIDEAQALLEELATNATVKAEAARRVQRLKLQTDYGQAVMWSKGFAAEETKAAFARVGEIATKMGNADAALDVHYARSFHNLWRGEFQAAREAAESFLREAERAARLTETAAAHRSLGLVLLFQGDFAQARTHCEQSLQIYDPERDREAKFRFGTDSAVSATTSLAFTAWCFGDVGRARELIDAAVVRATASVHAPTLAITYYTKALLETLRNDAEAARRAAEALVALSREHGIAHWLALGALPLAWARATLGDRETGSADFRRAMAEYASRGAKFYLPFYRGRLAEIEAEGGDAEAALAGIDEALALAGETGEHWFDAGLHRIRGEILLKQNPADPAPAEAAFLAAIAVAQQQKARGFELRAALSLAKLYRSTERATDAHDVLTPALAGFSPTPEFPAIAEALSFLTPIQSSDRL
jgi:predicted ATPase